MEIGLVLSGGGARGIAHLGVIKALSEKGIYPNKITGTSAGSLVGVMIASGYEPEAVLDTVIATRFWRLFRPALSRMGVFKIEKALDTYLKLLPNPTFEALKIPLVVAATDILEGNIVYFDKGDVIKPVLASCCLPGIFEPILYQNRLLVDGGVLNNLPVEPIVGECDFLIGVHVNPQGVKQAVKSVKDVLQRSLFLSVNNHTSQKKTQFDLFIEPPELKDYDVFDVKKAREIYRIGYKYTKETLALLSNHLINELR
ncbi:MAG: patatin-like phospholipase family protein [Spirosomataceae bacterium]